MTIVLYCPTCNYFLKTSVSGPIGTHGCMQCGEFMEVWIPQERAAPDWTHRSPDTTSDSDV